jgi:hypothetical protein
VQDRAMPSEAANMLMLLVAVHVLERRNIRVNSRSSKWSTALTRS